MTKAPQDTIAILIVHHTDEDHEEGGDLAEGAWQIWIPSSFQEYYDDNIPFTYGPTREAALQSLKDKLAPIMQRHMHEMAQGHDVHPTLAGPELELTYLELK